MPKTSAPKPKPTSPTRLSRRGRGSVDKVDDGRLQELFATNVRIVRMRRGMSQELLADLSDLDRTYISGVERNRRNVSIRTIQRIADALHLDVRVLLTPELDRPEFDALLAER